jgi:hypothetical protein
MSRIVLVRKEMCQKLLGATVMIHILRLCWLNMQNLTALKQQENVESAEAKSQRWKQQKLEVMPVLCRYCRLYRFGGRMECQFRATSHGNRWNFKPSPGSCVQMTQKNWFSLKWQFVRSYHCMLQGNVNEMRILICHPIMPPMTQMQIMVSWKH